MMANGFNGIFLVATNPCDIITWQVWQLSGLPRSQVLGTGVWLDTTRLRRLLAQELEIGAQSIDAFILGEHGDTQFPVWSHSSVYGTPIADLYQQRTGLPLDREAMADKVRKLGFEIYAGKGCTEYGVAGTIAEICRNIFTGSHRALAVSCILDGEYGVSGAAAGVPAVLAQGGVKQIIELQLAGEEQAKFSPVDRGDQGQYRPSALTAVCESVGNDQLRGKGLQRLAGFIRQVGVGHDIGQRRQRSDVEQ
ncbi:L-lactate dehydrogenase [Klebsiella pneumoniae subsp. rhinoscleromatis]|nr:L-lactate dehydrogenase [Klebsiella pneumoniae subsp. rhinoscleromatis]